MPTDALDAAKVQQLTDVEFIERQGNGMGAGRFKARLDGRRRPVSLLVFDFNTVDHGRLTRWARRRAALEHPRVPSVVRHETERQPGFIATEFVAATALEDRLAQGGLPEVEALSIVLQVAGALKIAHESRFGHGGLSIRNVLLSDRKKAFEQVHLVGWTPIDARHRAIVELDLRGLGALLYATLTGVVPPSSSMVGADLEGEGGSASAFDDMLMGWTEVERDISSGAAALKAFTEPGRFSDVSAFIDELVPYFYGLLDAEARRAEREAAQEAIFQAEVETRRAKQRDLESKLRFAKEWFREHAAQIRRSDEHMRAAAYGAARIRNAEVEMAMLLDRAAPAPEARIRPTARPLEQAAGNESWSVDTPAPVERADLHQDTSPLQSAQPLPEAAPAPSHDEARVPAPRGLDLAPGLRPDLAPAKSTPPAPLRAEVPETTDAAGRTLSLEPVAVERQRRQLNRTKQSNAGLYKLVAAMAAAALLGVLVVAWLLADPTVAPIAGAVEEDAGPRATARTEAPKKAPTSLPTLAQPPMDAGTPVDAAPLPVDAAPLPVDAAPLVFEPVGPEPPSPVPPTVEIPEGMVYVAAGQVHLSNSKAQVDTLLTMCGEAIPIEWQRDMICKPDRFASAPRTERVGAFYMDTYEVSQRQYAACRSAKKCSVLKLHWELKDQPATALTRDMAQKYCAWRGGRLPTMPEWMRAARGDSMRLFPWGDTSPGSGSSWRANTGKVGSKGAGFPEKLDQYKYPGRVKIFTKVPSPFGARNLAGNVKEWTASDRGKKAIVMGGGWRDRPFDLRVTRQEAYPPSKFSNQLGFRCVIDPK